MNSFINKRLFQPLRGVVCHGLKHTQYCSLVVFGDAPELSNNPGFDFAQASAHKTFSGKHVNSVNAKPSHPSEVGRVGVTGAALIAALSIPIDPASLG